MQKILVCDDERTTVQLIRRTLEGAGYQVVVAFDGIQTLHMARHERPDLILLDIMMPAQDGTKAAEYLSRLPTTSTIPIVFLSSKTPEQASERGSIAHARAYLQKPVSVTRLLSQVKEILERREQVPSDTVIGTAPAISPDAETGAQPDEPASEPQALPAPAPQIEPEAPPSEPTRWDF